MTLEKVVDLWEVGLFIRDIVTGLVISNCWELKFGRIVIHGKSFFIIRKDFWISLI